ncbi:MAG: WbuC family cupin fold metalloprotein [Anaerolineaceae bacterium]|nr:WbuC family cupin fold metalloprotein [Anaerolineaceae bacterium]
MRPITEALITDLITQAEQSERGRMPYRFHDHHEPVQRMLNALMPGTYVTPHKHQNPDKVELISILRGQAACIHFTQDGDIEAIFVLETNGPVRGVDIRPGVYHTFVALTPCAVLEIIQGPYEAATHKQFASWAPLEGTPEALSYLGKLESRIKAAIKTGAVKQG